MFVTFKTNTSPQPNIPFEDLFDMYNKYGRIPTQFNSKLYHTHTTIAEKDEAQQVIYNRHNFNLEPIKQFAEISQRFIDLGLETQYNSFYIPKRQGGFRRIDAPGPELSAHLKNIKVYLEKTLRCLTHDKAYAYVKGRSTKDAVKLHQDNKSKWFLKLDIKNFFTNCTEDFIYNQLNKLYPFPYLMEDPEIDQALKTIIKSASLNGGLPQGTPLSPTLTNLIMIPIDYVIDNYAKRNQMVYTRYADDMLISSEYKFKKDEVEGYVNELLVRDTPFKIKSEKTRFGSASGRNWNLGLMLNKDNQITVGYKKKAQFKVILNNFFKDFTSGIYWSIIDVQVLTGQASYYLNIEPEYFSKIIAQYEEKYELCFSNCTEHCMKL